MTNELKCEEHVNYTKWCVKCQAELSVFIRHIINQESDGGRIKELFNSK